MMSKYMVVQDGEIGRGRFGVVERVRRKRDQKILARKIIPIDGKADSKTKASQEYDIVRTLDHINIAGFLDLEYVPNERDARKLMLYMDYYEHHSLDGLVKRRARRGDYLAEDYIWSIIYQLSSALMYCHDGIHATASDSDALPAPVRKHRVLHRDIKPANVFLASDSETALDAIKLGDFGVGAILDAENKSTYVGTREYLPPEIRQSNPGRNTWTTKCDIFSLGCSLFELCDLRRTFDFHAETPSEIAQSLGGRYSKELNHCLKSCIDIDPVKRPDARALFSGTQKHMRGNPDYQRAVQNHLLLMGACEGDFEKVFIQLEKGTCIDTPLSTDEETPLHKAIRYGHLALVQFLLEKGADVSKKNKEGQTALHVAAASASEDHGDLLVEMLLDKKSSMAVFDDHNRTPLHVAAANNQVEIVRKLHECGMDIESTTRDSRRSRAIHIAAENGHLRVIEELEANGADIQATRAGEETAFQLAAEGGHTDLLKFFLTRGTKPDTPFGRDRLTALDQAVKNGHEEAVRILLESGASSRTRTAIGETPLHFAAATDSRQIIRLLVFGIDIPSMPNIPSGRLADIEARTNDKKTALHVAVYSRQSLTVDELLNLGCDYSAKTADGDTPLHHAALRNSLGIASALIYKGAFVSVRGPRQATPLHYAAYRGHGDMVKFLITNDKSTADLEERTHSGDTILHLAAYFGHTNLAVQLLKNFNFKVDLVNRQGETALHQAAARGKEDVLRELLSFGADFSIRSKSGQTARQMAEKAHHIDCAKRLVRLEHG